VTPKNTAAELVRQVVIPVERARKRELLSQLIRSGRIEQALVFTRTKHGAGRLAQQLERDGIARRPSTATRPSRSASARWTTSSAVAQASTSWSRPTSRRAGSTSTPCPTSSTTSCRRAEDYVHRIGRTGRAAPTATPSRW
jgi:ATP-dependent RNA helicase RhlE